MKGIFSSFFALALASVSVGGQERMPLVADGRPAVEIVLPTNAVNRTFNADIAFFTNAVARCTGAELPVVRRRSAGAAAIVFEIETRGFFDADDHEMAFPDERTLLVRGTLHSCRWALNRILERDFGCVFCLPGPHGTHYPRRTDVSVARTPFKGSASLRVERKMYADDMDWMRALGGRESARHGQFYGHSMWRILSPLRLKDTPLYKQVMPEKDGVRREIGKIHSGWQPCFSSEASVAEAVRYLNEYFDQHPNEKAYSLAVNDIGGHCTCAACARANGGFERKSTFYPQYVDYSPVYYTWANRVAEGVAAKHPDVALGLLAYCEVTDPPPFRLHPLLVPFVCTEIHQMTDAAAAKKRRELFAAWSEKSDHVANWGYDWGSGTYVVPRLYLGCQKAYFGMKTDGTCPHMGGYFGEGDGLIGEGPKRYMFYRQMFDANCDFDAELDRWYEAVGGKAAAPHLKAYYREWEDFWSGEAVRKSAWFRGVTGVYFIYFNHSYLYEFDREILVRAKRHLKLAREAAKASGDPDQRARVDRIAAFFAYNSARMRAMGAGHRPAGSAQEAQAFIDALPEISKAAREKATWADRILGDLGYPAYPVGRMEPYRDALKSFGEKAHVAREGNFMQLLNCAVAWAGRSPEVAAAIRRAADDPEVLDDVRKQLGMLALARSLPNLADGAVTEKTNSLFSWDRDGLPSGASLYCSLRLTNRQIGTQSYRVYFAGWNEKRQKYRDVDEVFVAVGPGETKDVSLFCRTGEGVTKGRIAVHMWRSELGAVSDLEVEDVRLCALPKEGI